MHRHTMKRNRICKANPRSGGVQWNESGRTGGSGGKPGCCEDGAAFEAIACTGEADATCEDEPIAEGRAGGRGSLLDHKGSGC